MTIIESRVKSSWLYTEILTGDLKKYLIKTKNEQNTDKSADGLN